MEHFLAVLVMIMINYTITEDNGRTVIGQYLLIILPVNHMESMVIIIIIIIIIT